MTGLTNPASGGDAALQAHLCDSAAEVDLGLAAAAQPDFESWRSEVAARLARYRTRRKPRAPRYPSLLLPFDAGESRFRPGASPSLATSPPVDDSPLHSAEAYQETSSSVPAAPNSGEPLAAPFAEPQRAPQPDSEFEPSAKVIEFPRSAAIPVFHASPLADPIFDRPRIVEAPEVVPPPPALGGMLIEPIPEELDDRRAAAEAKMPSASIPWRLLATLIDGLSLAAALAAFAGVFLRFNPIRGPLPLLAATSVALFVVLWMAYQFLFVVFTSSTPGLRVARLRIARLDGSPVTRPVRRWRVLASFLSAFSAGLGYLWCFFDQDSLCWHDRITRTNIQPALHDQPRRL